MNYIQVQEIINNHQLKNGSMLNYKGDQYTVIKLLPLPADEVAITNYIDTYLGLYPTGDVEALENTLIRADNLTIGALIKTDVIYRLIKIDELI